MQDSNRNHSIDILRGIAIFLVVFGHITHTPCIRTYIWGFHIPIFFFLSGLLFQRNKYASFIDFLHKRAVSLLIPYVIFYLITFCYWLFIERHTRGTEIEPWTQIVGLIYGTYSMKWMMFNGAMWFIPCLFSIETIYWFVSRSLYRIRILALLLVLYILGIIAIQYTPWLPFGLCAALTGIVFYGIGDCCKRILFLQKAKKNILYLSLAAVCLFLTQIYVLPYTDADLASLHITDKWTYIPISLLGICLYWIIAYIIGRNRALEFLGVNSLVIFAFQEPVYRAAIFVTTKIINQDTEYLRNNVILCVVVTFATIIIITPAIYAWNIWGKPLLKHI